MKNVIVATLLALSLVVNGVAHASQTCVIIGMTRSYPPQYIYKCTTYTNYSKVVQPVRK